jgi:dTDP-4-amino-4,6-dideoxygalactose transaminase
MSRFRIPFMSLVPGEDAGDVRRAIDRVIDRGWFVLGPEVSAFEEEFAAAAGAAHAVGVGTGTDAIALILRALGIGAGDEVITSPLSAAYSALAIMMAGARPVFADVDPERATIDPGRIAALVGPRTRAILPVHLYGQPADMAAIERIAARHQLAIVEDCCQAHLASSDGRAVGTIGVAGAFSFYPTKNLGALGDGGAVVTNDAALAGRIRRLRNGGQTDRYHHLEPGINSRLDEMQAAVLRARLPRLQAWTERRRALAARYRAALAGAPVVPLPERDHGHVYHLFVVTSGERDALQAHLAARGIETLIHYPVSIPRQPALAGEQPGDCPVAARLCGGILSLPLHPALRDGEIDDIAAAVHAFQPRAVVSLTERTS